MHFRSYKPGISLNWLVLASNHFYKKKIIIVKCNLQNFFKDERFFSLRKFKTKMLQRKTTMINDAICYFYEQLFFLDLKPLWAWMNISPGITLIKNLNKSKQWIVWWRNPLIPNINFFFGNLLVGTLQKAFPGSKKVAFNDIKRSSSL